MSSMREGLIVILSVLLVKTAFMKVLVELSCCIVFQKLTSRIYLTNHERTHSKEKNFKCGFCSKVSLMLQPFRKTIFMNIFFSYAQAFMQSQYLWFHMKNHQEARPYKCTKCPRVNKVLSQSLYFNSNYKPSYSHMQAFKQLAYCNKHISLCRPTKRQRINGPDDEREPEESAVFHPVFEQIGLHQVKSVLDYCKELVTSKPRLKEAANLSMCLKD